MGSGGDASVTGPTQTSGQVPRGARPDAVRNNRPYLIKNVPRLRCTYQIKVLTALAEQGGQRLTVVLPQGARLSADLAEFVRAHKSAITIERRAR